MTPVQHSASLLRPSALKSFLHLRLNLPALAIYCHPFPSLISHLLPRQESLSAFSSPTATRSGWFWWTSCSTVGSRRGCCAMANPKALWKRMHWPST
jgi:hypothetical protein